MELCCLWFLMCVFKQKTAYDVRISDWSSDVCSSDLRGAVATFAQITDRGASETLRGTLLTVPRSALPALAEGEYYHHDLLGLPCVSTDGAAIGHVAAVENFGAGDILEIEKPNGKRFMVPMTARAVPAWNDDSVTVEAAFVE